MISQRYLNKRQFNYTNWFRRVTMLSINYLALASWYTAGMMTSWSWTTRVFPPLQRGGRGGGRGVTSQHVFPRSVPRSFFASASQGLLDVQGFLHHPPYPPFARGERNMSSRAPSLGLFRLSVARPFRCPRLPPSPPLPPLCKVGKEIGRSRLRSRQCMITTPNVESTPHLAKLDMLRNATFAGFQSSSSSLIFDASDYIV